MPRCSTCLLFVRAAFACLSCCVAACVLPDVSRTHEASGGAGFDVGDTAERAGTGDLAKMGASAGSGSVASANTVVSGSRCDICASTAQCISIPGARAVCLCPQGQRGDGTTCEPDPMCAALGCDAHAHCSTDLGAHACHCAEGWIGDGWSCADDDECAMPGRCNSNALCQNIPGSYRCACRSGYEDVRGDGSECVNKCVFMTCPNNAKCQIKDGAAICACEAGYEQSGLVCVGVDPCKGIRCGANASCKAGTCVCNPGFSGDPNRCVAEAKCGDGSRQPSEQCDGLDLSGATCASIGFDGGTLSCDASCNLDRTGCKSTPLGGSGASGSGGAASTAGSGGTGGSGGRAGSEPAGSGTGTGGMDRPRDAGAGGGAGLNPGAAANTPSEHAPAEAWQPTFRQLPIAPHAGSDAGRRPPPFF